MKKLSVVAPSPNEEVSTVFFFDILNNSEKHGVKKFRQKY